MSPSGAALGVVVASPFAVMWFAIPWPWALLPVSLFLGFGAFAGACILEPRP